MKKFLALLGLGIAFVGVWFASAMVQSQSNDDVVKAQSKEEATSEPEEKIEYAFLLHKREHNGNVRLDVFLKSVEDASKKALAPRLFEYSPEKDTFYSKDAAGLIELNKLGADGWQIIERNYPDHDDFFLKRKVKN